jgi:hypothetical protein
VRPQLIGQADFDRLGDVRVHRRATSVLVALAAGWLPRMHPFSVGGKLGVDPVTVT